MILSLSLKHLIEEVKVQLVGSMTLTTIDDHEDCCCCLVIHKLDHHNFVHYHHQFREGPKSGMKPIILKMMTTSITLTLTLILTLVVLPQLQR